jgi:hypothetical protein
MTCIRYNTYSKMDGKLKTEAFAVVSCFTNGACQFVDKVGRVSKYRVNIGSLK